MERNPITRQNNHRRWPNRGKKLLLYCLTAILVFFLGMLLGGLLSRADDSGASPEMQESGKKETMLIDVDYIDQKERYPTACESVSAVMALRHGGMDISVEEFIDDWLPKGSAPEDKDGSGVYVSSDPNLAFMGNPYSENGWGCYAPVIKEALDKLLAAKGSAREAVDLTGEDLEKLCEDYIAWGTPVIVWATAFMAEPQYGLSITAEETGRWFDWITPEHCMVLVGADETHYYFNDPLAGKAVKYEKAEAERAYDGLGKQALAIR